MRYQKMHAGRGHGSVVFRGIGNKYIVISHSLIRLMEDECDWYSMHIWVVNVVRA